MVEIKINKNTIPHRYRNKYLRDKVTTGVSSGGGAVIGGGYLTRTETNDLFEKVSVKVGSVQETTDDNKFVYTDEAGRMYYATHDKDGEIASLTNDKGVAIADWSTMKLTALMQDVNVSAIKAKYDFFSVGGVAAYGIDKIPTNSGAAAVLTQKGTGIADKTFNWDGALTTTEKLGSIPANTTFPVGTTLEEIIRRMLCAKPSILEGSVSISSTTEQEIGTRGINVNITISQNNSGELESAVLYRKTGSGNYSQIVELTGTKIYNDADYILSDATTYRVVAKFKASKDFPTPTTKDVTVTITPYWKWYAGQLSSRTLPSDFGDWIKENALANGLLYRDWTDLSLKVASTTDSQAWGVFVAVPKRTDDVIPILTDQITSKNIFTDMDTNYNKKQEFTLSALNNVATKDYDCYYYVVDDPISEKEYKPMKIYK